MANNEIKATEIKETTENVESKKFNPATGMVVVLAAYGIYRLIVEGGSAAKKLVRKIEAKRAESVDNDVVEDDIFEE